MNGSFRRFPAGLACDLERPGRYLHRTPRYVWKYRQARGISQPSAKHTIDVPNTCTHITRKPLVSGPFSNDVGKLSLHLALQ